MFHYNYAMVPSIIPASLRLVHEQVEFKGQTYFSNMSRRRAVYETQTRIGLTWDQMLVSTDACCDSFVVRLTQI